MDLANLNLLEERLRNLLAFVTTLQEENRKIKTELIEGTSLEKMLDQKKRQQLRIKIEGLLELLKDF
jgi:F0F1-type ATP synthase alpha subunit